MLNTEIIFQDSHLIAVNKKARQPVAAEKSGDPCLLDEIRSWNSERQDTGKKGYCVPIHFLDRPVSGVVLFGLSSKAAARLNEMFRHKKLQKHYLACVLGRPALAQARLEHYLCKQKADNKVRICQADEADAKLCTLEYEVLASNSNCSLLLVKPETGRSHQIRVQLASLGTPILGDMRYGASEPWDHRIALHAYALHLKHPVGARPMQLKAPLPEYWRNLPIDLDPEFF